MMKDVKGPSMVARMDKIVVVFLKDSLIVQESLRLYQIVAVCLRSREKHKEFQGLG